MVRCSCQQGLNCIIGLFDAEEDEKRIQCFKNSCFGETSPLYWRVPIFIWSVIILLWSVVCFWGPQELFLIYMTHWGLCFIVLESSFGAYVAIHHRGVTDATFGLPWYVKVYWLLYNITIPVSFLITIFYWAILRNGHNPTSYSPYIVLDVMAHGGNSIVMFIELICSAHPSRLMHIMQPLWFAGAYMLFSVIYYFAGGIDPFGNRFIYPVLDWSKPEKTMVVITLTALSLALIHLLVVGTASARDAVVKRRQMEPAGVYNDAFTP